MRVYADFLNPGDELFSDAETPLIEDNLIGAPAKFIKVGGGIDESLIGANASAEEPIEQNDSEQCETKLSCEHNFQVKKLDEGLGDAVFNKKFLRKYWLKYYTKLMKKFKEDDDQEHVQDCKTHGQNAITQWLEKYSPDDDDVFAKETITLDEPNTPLFIGKWSESGLELTLWTIKRCLVDNKV